MIEIIPRAKARAPWWINAILAASLIFLALSIIGQISLSMIVKNVNKEIEDTKQEIAELKTSTSQEGADQLLGYQVQLRNFNKILSEHYLISRVLDLMEDTIHPEVVYQDFLISAVERRIQLTGLTRSYVSIGEQLLVFNNDDRIERVETSDYSRDKDGWISFRLMIDFKPTVIQ